MTNIEARALLAKFPDNALFCFSDGQQIFEATQIELVPVNAEGEVYAAADDGAISVAVVA